MQEFRQQNNTLIWEQGREIVHIEPWGKDSLRVRATVNPEIRHDLPGALLEAASTDAQIEIGEARAVIRNGAIAAEIVPQGDFIHPNVQASSPTLQT